MHRAVAFAAAAAAAFIGTTLYLRQHQSRVGQDPATRVGAHPAQALVTPRATGRAQPSPHVVPIHHVEPSRVPAEDPNAEDRRQLAEYVGGISNVAPLSAEQQQA